MGQVLAQYYDRAKEQGGLEAQIKLAMFTKIPSVKAEEIEDSEENIQLFEDAMKSIFG